MERFDVILLTRETVEASAKIRASLIRGSRRTVVNGADVAATAVSYNLMLGTRNGSHFEKTKGLNLEAY